MNVKEYYAKVAFTDATGAHKKGDLVEVPYETDADKAAAESALAYGVLSERKPETGEGDKSAKRSNPQR